MTGPKQVSVKLTTSLGPEFRVPEAQLVRSRRPLSSPQQRLIAHTDAPTRGYK